MTKKEMVINILQQCYEAKPGRICNGIHCYECPMAGGDYGCTFAYTTIRQRIAILHQWLVDNKEEPMTNLEHAKLLLAYAKTQPVDATIAICNGQYVSCGQDCTIRTVSRECLIAGHKTIGEKIVLLKQWIRDNEYPTTIDLDVNQIIDPPVKAWCRSCDKNPWYPSRLCSIDHRRKSGPYITVNDDGSYSYCDQCSLTKPVERTVKVWMTIYDVPIELWGKVLVKTKGRHISTAVIMTPKQIWIEGSNHLIFLDLEYLPLGQPLDGKWLPMETVIES